MVPFNFSLGFRNIWKNKVYYNGASKPGDGKNESSKGLKMRIKAAVIPNLGITKKIMSFTY
jgi:hypothetical protein